MTNIVWTRHTLEYNFVMKHKFAKYLKESCRSDNFDDICLTEEFFGKYLNENW